MTAEQKNGATPVPKLDVPLLQPEDHQPEDHLLVFIRGGATFKKYCQHAVARALKGWSNKFVFYHGDHRYGLLYWCVPGEDLQVVRDPGDRFMVIGGAHPVTVRAGKTTPAFKVSGRAVNEHCCFSVASLHRTLSLEAKTQEQRDLWVEVLTKIGENAAGQRKKEQAAQDGGAVRPRSLLDYKTTNKLTCGVSIQNV